MDVPADTKLDALSNQHDDVWSRLEDKAGVEKQQNERVLVERRGHRGLNWLMS